MTDSAGTPSTPKHVDIDGFMNLLEGIPLRPGMKRRPAVRANVEKFVNALSELTGWPVENFDVRTLNSNQQTSRARGESTHGKISRDLNDDRWVFIARITSSQNDLIPIFNNFRRNLAPICSIAILAADKPKWHAYKIMFRPEYEQTADLIADYLNIPEEDRVPFVEDDIKRKLSQTPSLNSAPLFDESTDSFMSDEEFETIIDIWLRKKNLILTGPPGVGKTFIIQALARAVTYSSDPRFFLLTQFHQSTSYEDFIRGWRPIEGAPGFSLVDGTFVKFCDLARSDPENNYVFAIDEINRANLSRVFGELLMLIEGDKRSPQNALRLAYRHAADPDETFFVPPNVFLIGTMNTADRSLALVDTAMRRRFAFHKLRPQFHSEQFADLLKGRGISNNIIEIVRKRISALNLVISSDKRSLGEGYEIGHSFFCPPGNVPDDEAWYFSVVASEIAPLLEEYWFDDDDQVAAQIAMLMEPILLSEEHLPSGSPPAA